MGIDKHIVVIMQPGYIPWIGFFELMYRARVFFVFDIVRFDKNGWRNRNQIKTANGPLWLTVPVHARNEPLLCDILIDNKKPWQKKHLKSIEANYSKSQYFEKYFPRIKEILSQEWEYLDDLNLEFIKFIAESFGIQTELFLVSKIKERGKIEKLGRIELCKLAGGDIFYEPAGGKDYLLPEQERFERQGIKIVLQNITPKPYKQIFGQFIPNLSSLDLLFNEGEAGREIIIKSGEEVII